MQTPLLESNVHHYELLCLDADRTRSIWLTHPAEFSAAQLNTMIDEVVASVPRDQLVAWGREAQAMHQFTLNLGQHLDVDPRLLERLEKQASSEEVTFSAVIDRVVDRLCETHHFARLSPTAAVVRYGAEVLAA